MTYNTSNKYVRKRENECDMGYCSEAGKVTLLSSNPFRMLLYQTSIHDDVFVFLVPEAISESKHIPRGKGVRLHCCSRADLLLESPTRRFFFFANKRSSFPLSSTISGAVCSPDVILHVAITFSSRFSTLHSDSSRMNRSELIFNCHRLK